MRIVEIRRGSEGAQERVELDFEHRIRRRAVFTTDKGREIVLDQQRPQHLRDGHAFVLEDGSIVGISAKPEPLISISSQSDATLVRIAWHLGNRHLPTQIVQADNGNQLRIRTDHVIELMAGGLGGMCVEVEAPFDPEGGAYDSNLESGDLRARSDPATHGHRHGLHGHDH